MRRNISLPILSFVTTAALIGLFNLGCSLDSGESATRTVGVSVAGFYIGDPSGNLVRNNTGSPVATMDLRQNGDSLEGIDNNGHIFKGTIGAVDTDGTSASFTLVGQTTAGQEGVMSGTIQKPSDTTAQMRGTWAEPTLFSTISGMATVPANPVSGGTGTGTNGTTNTVSALILSPGAASIAIAGTLTQNFSASGGTGPYTFTVTDGSLGAVSTSDSAAGTATYTAIAISGNQTVRVTDSDGATDDSSVTQN